MMPSFSADKRRDRRVPVRIPIRFRLLKSPVGEGAEPALHNGHNLMSDISRSGFFLFTKHFLEVHSVIEVEFVLEAFREVLKAEAGVVRTNNYNFPNQGKHEYGLRFSAMHPHFRQILEKFVEMTRP